MDRASADVGLIFIAYNLRRLMNIIDRNLFKKFLGEFVSFFLENKHINKITELQDKPLFVVCHPKKVLH